MEDKQRICDFLCSTLQKTRQFTDLLRLKYDPKYEIVTAEFLAGTKQINVAMIGG